MISCPRIGRRFVAAVLVTYASVLASSSAAAQVADTLTTADTASTVTEAIGVPESPARAYPPATPVSGASEIPEPTTPPATLRAYWHVFIAFAIAWLLVFGYAILLGRRLARLEREIGEIPAAK